MALTHAILVALSEQSGSGYELARRFDRSIGYFWSATHQQIYRTLRAMEGDDWVHSTAVVQHGRPDKKVYTVSAAGRAELARWIADPADRELRDIAVKLRGAGAADLPALLRQLVTVRAEHAARLDTYLDIEKRQFPDPAGLSGAALQQHLVLRGGISAERGSVGWLDEVLGTLGPDR